MNKVAVLISFGALIISATSFYYAHLRRSDILIEIDEERIKPGASSWSGAVLKKCEVILPLYIVNKGGGTGTFEEFKAKIKEDHSRKNVLFKPIGKLQFEETNRGHSRVPERLSVKEGEIIPLTFKFLIKIKGADKFNDEKIPYIAKLVDKIKDSKIIITYKTKWPEKKHKEYISSELLLKQVKKVLIKKWEKDGNPERSGAIKQGMSILNKNYLINN